MPRAFSELTFATAVRAHQERMGSAKTYAKFVDGGPQQGHQIGPVEKAFIEARDGFYQSTVSETGWPYVQHRGGPKGFLKVIDSQTMGYADYSGNKQYIISFFNFLNYNVDCDRESLARCNWKVYCSHSPSSINWHASIF